NSLKYEVIGKAYSDSHKRGTICLQSIEANTLVDKETTVQLTISLGSQAVKVPNIAGLFHDDAYIKLLETGFLPDNIEFIDKYDETAASEAVINTDPEIGTAMSTDSVIKVFINTYTETADEELFSVD
ncbi:MAG: PASTA domain-containing protein, partial [Clostridia bacterium]|nr:PASTA domain-containing protein [Clostridia bacterium]